MVRASRALLLASGSLLGGSRVAIGLGFRASGLQGFRVSGFQGFRVSGFQGFRVSGFQGSGCRFRVWGIGILGGSWVVIISRALRT